MLSINSRFLLFIFGCIGSRVLFTVSFEKHSFLYPLNI